MKKFDFVVGNPPFDEETENNTRKKPLYHYFLDASNKISRKSILIHPARFLFNAGQTPKDWNKKILNDKHFNILKYESDGSKYFEGKQIKGGIAISYRDEDKIIGPIKIFTNYAELTHIVKKIDSVNDNYLNNLVSPRGNYRFTNDFFRKYPYAKEKFGKGTSNMIVSNVMDKIPEVFNHENELEDNLEYVKILGRENNKRKYMYLKREFVIDNPYIDTFNVTLPESNGSGKFGEKLSTPLVSKPSFGSTDTFINIGNFETLYEAESCLKYIKTKFTRALLGVKKVTQHNPSKVWKYVPLQDFTENSDIDWSKSIPEIDQQLYKKYGLSPEEIEFIEEKVQEME